MTNTKKQQNIADQTPVGLVSLTDADLGLVSGGADGKLTSKLVVEITKDEISVKCVKDENKIK